MKKLIAILATLMVVIPWASTKKVQAAEETPSQRYVEAMGSGWNLGNTFDGFDEAGDTGETSWSNPVVTRELISSVKDKGYDSIRMPFTAHMRVGGAESNYQLDEAFLDRYEEVVNWALEEDLYVMINVHHDSWIWLADWDGNTEAEAYKKYVRIWEQLADRFKDYDERVMFESINEPQFYTDEANALSHLEKINNTFHTIIRNSGGRNAERMLILPTLVTDSAQSRLDALYQQIVGLEDENIIATIHYYSEWVFSANLGTTQFDDELWDGVTARTSLINTFDRIAETFTENGIGVVIGEYGLLGYDKGDDVNPLGETLKFLEFINYYADQKGLNLILWDNGQHIDRYTYQWKNTRFGDMIESSMEGRSAYSTGWDTTFLNRTVPESGISIPLTLNGLTLAAVSEGDTALTAGVDYTMQGTNLQLTEAYLNRLLERTGGVTGSESTLRLQFDGGADWYQTLVYSEAPVMSEAQGTVSEGIRIPTAYNGSQLKSVVSQNEAGAIVSNNSWWRFLEHSSEFVPNESENTIDLLTRYTSILSDGQYTLTFTYYDGTVIPYQLSIQNGGISGQVVTAVETPEVTPKPPVEAAPGAPIEETPGEVTEPEEPEETISTPDTPTVSEPETMPEAENLENKSNHREMLDIVGDREAEGYIRIEEEPIFSSDNEEVSKAQALPATGMTTSITGFVGSLLLSSGLGMFFWSKRR
ncbi:cellulase family glycosylhydrolase [Marinilactibacillus kalidii]|uniref:cellulase family glycosylhydrolase n=1 Tax=Marinilactibacillus kalidii TaxID=2820274 RepID=UPI001ABE5670|nr:cellulase family glycosylhydrolase [Marinilactibacillus kalidii]